MPCNGPARCIDGICHYSWAPDRDGDGVVDNTCGGPDCVPNNPSVPGPVEVCNGLDDDCNGEWDDIPGSDTDPLNCGRCGNPCSFYQRDICVDGACTCAPGRMPGAGRCSGWKMALAFAKAT